MSETSAQRQANPKAEAVQSAASQWLERRERNDWNGGDEEEFASWLAASPAHTIAYMRVEDIWNRANRLRALNHPEHGVAESSGRTSLARMAAALVAIVLVSAASIAYMRAPRDALYTTGIGQHQNVQLADGSRVELNTDTALRIAMQGQTRIATLEKGEAYFDIRHDAKHAFIVRVGGTRVVDLGTQFSIRRDSGRIRVAVFEGRARFDLAEGGAPARSRVLVPGDVAIAKSGTVGVAKLAPQVLADGIAWRHGELAFHFTSLADAAAEFNRYNRKKLSVEGSQIARMQIGGTFGMHDVMGFGRQVSRLLGIRADDRGTEIVLSR